MGSSGFNIRRGKQAAYIDIAEGETNYLLQIKGHRVYDKHITSRFVPFKTKEEITQEVLDAEIEDYKSYENVFESLILFELSKQDISTELEYEKPSHPK